MTSEYRELQAALKAFKAEGKTNIKLNSTKAALQAEFDRLLMTTATEPEPEPEAAPEPAPTAKIYQFSAMVKRAKRPPAKGFATREKRYDQLTLTEWRAATLAFMGDDAQPMMMAA